MAAITTAVSIGVLAVSSEINRREQKEAAEEQLEVEQNIASANAARKRRAVLREARIKRAETQNLAGAVGAQESSAAIAGASNVTARAASNIADINQDVEFGRQLSEARQNVFESQFAGKNIFTDVASGIAGAGLQSFGQQGGAALAKKTSQPSGGGAK
jgi:hypothetical protein